MDAQPETSAQNQQRASETLLRRQLDQINVPPLGSREDETRTLVRRAMFDARAEPQTTGVSLAASHPRLRPYSAQGTGRRHPEQP